MTSLRSAIESATDFLLASRNPDGWWEDFRFAPGASDEWLTAYVADALASAPNHDLAPTLTDAWRLLCSRRRPSGAWGFNLSSPGDADSTGWAVRLAYHLGEEASERTIQARVCLAQYQRANGGIATYATDGPVRRYIRAPDDLSFCGWCSAHACVTAAVAVLPDFRAAGCAYLRQAQRDDGSWGSYWWCEPEYATAFAVAALKAEGHPESQRHIQRALAWVLARITPEGTVPTRDHPDGSPFAAALCCQAILLGDDSPAAIARAGRAIERLLQQQQADGSWSAAARLRLPWPDDEDPDTYEGWVYSGRPLAVIVLDRRRIFTTVTVLRAMQMFESMVEI